jgi:hypothetical protein
VGTWIPLVPLHPNDLTGWVRPEGTAGSAPRASPRKAIGHQLFISERTVARHLTAAFDKLGTNTRAQAVAVAAQRGLL